MYGWFARFDTSGRLLWQKRLSTTLKTAHGVAIDRSGNIIVTGETSYSSKTGTDAWIEKYTSSGQRIWGRRFNSGGREGDRAFRVAVDGTNNIYIAGTSGQPTTFDDDALLVKFSPAGTLQWQKRFSTSGDTECNGIAVDRSNNIILVGNTRGPLFGPYQYLNRDVWVAKIDQNGRTLWGRQITEPRRGSQTIYGKAVATDAKNSVLIVVEDADARLPGSTQDGRLAVLKFNPSGSQTWVRQFQYPVNPYAQYVTAVSTDASSNVVVAGFTGMLNAGSLSSQAYVRKYSPTGGLLWDTSYSSGINGEGALGVATDRLGHIYVAGVTWTTAVSQNRNDGFLAKFPPQ